MVYANLIVIDHFDVSVARWPAGHGGLEGCHRRLNVCGGNVFGASECTCTGNSKWSAATREENRDDWNKPDGIVGAHEV